MAGVYEKLVDRDSAYEFIKGRTDSRLTEATKRSTPADTAPAEPGSRTAARTAPPAEAPAVPERSIWDSVGDLMGGGQRRTRASAGEQMIKSAASSIGREVGRQVIRGVLGSIFGGSRR